MSRRRLIIGISTRFSDCTCSAVTSFMFRVSYLIIYLDTYLASAVDFPERYMSEMLSMF